jgi:hypothetical protein
MQLSRQIQKKDHRSDVESWNKKPLSSGLILNGQNPPAPHPNQKAKP